MPDSYGGLPPSEPTKQPQKRPATRPMDELQLLAMLRREEADASSYYTSELAQAQTDAMDAYHGKLRGDELLPNRSQHVTHDIEDTINWIMPALMRTFAPGDDFLTVDDDALDDNDPTLKTACDYLRHVYFKDNQGEVITHDFCFDALLQKVGIARVYWEEPEPKPAVVLTNVGPEQLLKYENDPDYEVLEVAQDGIEPEEPQDAEATEPEEMAEPQPEVTPLVPQAMPEAPEPTFTIKVQHKPRHGKCCIECIPPEEFRISRRARSIKRADYHGWQHDDFMANLVRLHPDKAHEIDPEGNYQAKPSDVNDTDGDVRVLARYPDEPSSGQRASYNEEQRHKVVVLIEYIRVDFDGDGIVELRRVKRCGNVILENDIVDESEFVVWSPIRVSHRLVGRSLADTILDIQKIRTALVRRGMDSLARATAPRTFVSSQVVNADPTVLDRLLDHDIGDVIDVAGNPNEVISVVSTPDVSPTCFQAIEYMDRRSEEASGVNRHAMGIQPQAITDTKGGIDMLMAAGNARVEQVARWLGFGLEELFSKALRTLVRNQDHARVVKINGKKMEIDPRRWSDEMTVTVHVGMAGESRERRIIMLDKLLGLQRQAMVDLGPNNPIVGLPEIRNTAARMTQAMGYKNASEFWKEIPEGWTPPPQQQQPDPKLLEVQGKQQLAQAELQGKMQLQQAELQHKDKVAALDHERQLQEIARKGDLELQVQMRKADSESEIARIKLESEQQLARERMAQERELALEKMAQEGALAREQMQLRASIQEPSVGGGFRPGGKLDA